MNEQILDAITAQARAIATTESDGGQTFNINKFEATLIELVVQECITQCRQQWYDTNNDEELNAIKDPRTIGMKIGTKQGALQCINRITKHFGDTAYRSPMPVASNDSWLEP